MMRLVWIAAIAAGALCAGSGTSPAQYPAPYPPSYAPPLYTQRQLIPDHPPQVGYKPYATMIQQPGGPPAFNQPGWGGENGGGPQCQTYGCGPQFQANGPVGNGVAPGSDPAMYSGYANPNDVFVGCYVAGMFGGMYLEDQYSEALDSEILRQEDAAFDWTVSGGGAIGYRMPTRPIDIGQLRFEFDTLYQQNNIKRLIFNGSQREAKGHVSANSFMFNMVLDFIQWKHEAITPYIGGGIGVLRINEHLIYGSTRLVDTDAVFAFQGMAGISVQLCENIEWFTEWRYLGGSNPKFNRVNPNTTPATVELISEYNTHAVMSGLRINLR